MINRILTLFFIVSVLVSCKKDNELVIDDPNDVIAVQSSCNANQTIKNIYIEDAYRLALRTTMNDNGSPWRDSVIISPELVTDIHQALLAVHNGLGMIFRDTVIAHYGIHTYPDPILNRMLVKVDNSKSWVQNWIQGAQTVHPVIDEMMDTYNLRFAGYYQWTIGNYVKLESDDNLNIDALTDYFKAVDGVLDAQIDAEPGDGNDISYSYNSTRQAKELTYSVGYTLGQSDCGSQCTKRRYYKFRILDFNCSVEFKGAWGDLPPL